jgi:hypothetical protein
MKKFIKEDISEKHLEELIRRMPDQIEEGLMFVDHQNKQPGGRLDVLLVDSGGALVVAELKVEQDDGMLLQGLDYYDYVTTNIEALARVYKDKKVNATQEVRLFLIAPSFSFALINRCKWLDLPISLFTFISGRCEGASDLMAIFTEQEIPSKTEIIEMPTIEDHLNYITDTAVRRRMEKLVDEIQSWDPDRIELKPIKYHLSFKFDNHVLTYLSSYRKHFLVEYNDQDNGWQKFKVISDEDLEQAREIVKTVLMKMKNGK